MKPRPTRLPDRAVRSSGLRLACALLAAGLALQALSISPMTALVWSAVLNGIVAVPLMAVILIMARRRAVMGAFVVPRILIWLGWIGTAVMALAAGLMLVG